MQGADVVIYGGGIYAGAIAGSSFLDKMAEHIVPEHFIVFTTGLNDISNLSLLSMVMMRNVPDRLRRGCFEFHFYGALSYDSLKFMDRVMFRAMLSGIKAKKPEARDLRETALLNIKKERVDLVDLSSAEPLIAPGAGYRCPCGTICRSLNRICMMRMMTFMRTIEHRRIPRIRNATLYDNVEKGARSRPCSFNIT